MRCTAPPSLDAPRDVVRRWFITASMACDGAAHWSLAGAEEEEKRGFGVSFSIRVDLRVNREAVGVETQEAGAYCPGFQKILVSG